MFVYVVYVCIIHYTSVLQLWITQHCDGGCLITHSLFLKCGLDKTKISFSGIFFSNVQSPYEKARLSLDRGRKGYPDLELEFLFTGQAVSFRRYFREDAVGKSFLSQPPSAFL